MVGTRDCSLQRRYQKLVEEAPAPFLTDAQRTELERSAAAVCGAAGYVNAGTVEFLLSPRGDLSFLEVNARLQVEHSATEEATDTDLVRAQLLIAAGHTVAAALGMPQRRTSPPCPRAAIRSSFGSMPKSRPGLPALGPASSPTGSAQRSRGPAGFRRDRQHQVSGSSTRCWPS